MTRTATGSRVDPENTNRPPIAHNHLHIGAEFMDCEQRDDAQIVCLSSEEATDCVRDPERGLELLREALETCVARNEHRPRSSAFIAISLDNMQSITDLFGAPVAEPVFGGLVGRLKECV